MEFSLIYKRVKNLRKEPQFTLDSNAVHIIVSFPITTFIINQYLYFESLTIRYIINFLSKKFLITLYNLDR